MVQKARIVVSLMFCSVACLLGCGDEEVRGTKAIEEDIYSLPAMYMTASGDTKVAPGNEDPETNGDEIYWLALTCTHPDCPGQGDGEHPYLFVCPDPRFYVENGEVKQRDFKNAEELERFARTHGMSVTPECPACKKIRNPATETAQQKMEYMTHVKPYELPSTVRAREKLQAELVELRKKYKQGYSARE